jgi:hypothetical protein
MDNEVKVRETIKEIKLMLDANNDYAVNLIAQHWRLWKQALIQAPKADYIGDILNFLGYITDFKSFNLFMPELEKYLDHPEAEYRAYAIQALGGGQFSQYLPKLARMARTDEKNRCLLCYCLSNFPEAEGELIIKTLSWIIREKNSADQYHALQSLSYWEGPEVVNTFKWAVINGSSEGNRRKAKELLGLYGEHMAYTPRMTRETMLAMAI